MKYGFIKEEVKDEDYIFGAGQIVSPVLQPKGQWFEYLPEYEPQSTNAFDTYGCTIFTTLNGVETLMNRQFGIMPNYAERFQYNLIPIRPPGGSPQVVAESIRKNGLVEQKFYPMTDSFEQYITPEPVPENLIERGKQWLKSYEFKHDYLWKSEPTSLRDRNEILKEALKYSPIGISVTAWNENGGLFEDKGMPNNHWTLCVGYEEVGQIFIPIVFDTYDHSIKRLSSFHHIEMAKRYYISPAKAADESYSWFDKLRAWFKGLQYIGI